MTTRIINIGDLTGHLDSPSQYARILGVIIMIPCFTCAGTLSGLKKISDILTDRGYITLRIDMSGVGLSKGDFESQTIRHHVDDLIKFTDYAAANYSKDIIYVGHGLGGIIGLIASESTPVKGIITLSTPLDDDSYDFIKIGLNTPDDQPFSRVVVNDKTLLVRKDFMDGIGEEQIVDLLEKCKRPVLSIFFEEEKETVPYDKTMQLIKNMETSIETILLKGVTHFMDNDIDSYYVGNFIDIWVQNKLNLI